MFLVTMVDQFGLLVLSIGELVARGTRNWLAKLRLLPSHRLVRALDIRKGVKILDEAALDTGSIEAVL